MILQRVPFWKFSNYYPFIMIGVQSICTTWYFRSRWLPVGLTERLGLLSSFIEVGGSSVQHFVAGFSSKESDRRHKGLWQKNLRWDLMYLCRLRIRDTSRHAIQVPNIVYILRYLFSVAWNTHANIWGRQNPFLLERKNFNLFIYRFDE